MVTIALAASSCYGFPDLFKIFGVGKKDKSLRLHRRTSASNRTRTGHGRVGGRVQLWPWPRLSSERSCNFFILGLSNRFVITPAAACSAETGCRSDVDIAHVQVPLLCWPGSCCCLRGTSMFRAAPRFLAALASELLYNRPLQRCSEFYTQASMSVEGGRRCRQHGSSSPSTSKCHAKARSLCALPRTACCVGSRVRPAWPAGGWLSGLVVGGSVNAVKLTELMFLVPSLCGFVESPSMLAQPQPSANVDRLKSSDGNPEGCTSDASTRHNVACECVQHLASPRMALILNSFWQGILLVHQTSRSCRVVVVSR